MNACKEYVPETKEEKFTRIRQIMADNPAYLQEIDQSKAHRLHAIEKQATLGNVTGERPSIDDYEAQIEFDAWEAVFEMPKEKAMDKYLK